MPDQSTPSASAAPQPPSPAAAAARHAPSAGADVVAVPPAPGPDAASPTATPDTPAPAAPATPPAGTAEFCTPAEAVELIRQLAMAFNCLVTYPAGHKLTVQGLQDTHAALQRVLTRTEAVNYALANGVLYADGRKLEFRAPLVANLLRKCTAHGVDNFALVRGMSQAELQTFLELLTKPEDRSRPPGAFSQALAGQAVQNIRVRTGKMLLVTDDDVLLRKKELEKKLAEAKTPVDQIVAFIRGEEVPSPTQVSADVASMATDADKLAELLLKATTVTEQTAAVEDAETLESIVIGSIRRLCDSVTTSPQARTQKGRRDLQRTLMVLEEKIVEKLRTLAGVTDRLVEATSAVFEEARKDLQVDALAAEYLAKRKAIENAEKKLLTFLKRKGQQEEGLAGQLKDRLLEGGMSPDGWKELVVRSRPATGPGPGPGGPAAGAGVGAGPGAGGPEPGAGAGAGPGPGGSEAAAESGAGAGAGAGQGPGEGGDAEPTQTWAAHLESVNVLAMLLTQLDSLLNPVRRTAEGKPRKEALNEVVDKVDEHLDSLVTQAEQRIAVFADIARRIQEVEGSHREDVEKLLSRKEILAILAELVQELRQPLSVLTCSNDMILSGWLGEITDEQRSMLAMSASSSQRLADLVNKLENISGLPPGTHPDDLIRGYLYTKEQEAPAGAGAPAAPAT